MTHFKHIVRQTLEVYGAVWNADLIKEIKSLEGGERRAERLIPCIICMRRKQNNGK